MTGKKWVSTFLILFLCVMIFVGGVVAFVDPFFHYRAPRDYFYYKLYDQRSQNDGITKRFDYDAMLTGTSMAENFKASRFDELFGTNSVKIVYAGATYKEINDNLKVSYDTGHALKYVFRPIDYSLLLRDKDEMRMDMGEYPVWITNKNLFDDVKYLFNRDVILHYVLPTLVRYFKGQEPGVTPFDEYSYTGDENEYSGDVVLNVRTSFDDPKETFHATDDEILMVAANVDQNIVSLAKEHPETTFLYFFPPYSMAYWGEEREEGDLQKNLELIKVAASLMLECDNIHLYSFAYQFDVTGNLDNYKDVAHYSPEINDLIEAEIADVEKNGIESDKLSIRITEDNVDSFFDELSEILENYDYNSLCR
ncbi:hypothetical protein D6855_08425 [Butyrivibrio sp. CB08]|uniref:hypothetical protein n=1 Tax=Butyrivibrio sp. CB08 TaxID=2364879 RepID=UPI000EA9C8F6|nr:hypothetical protein [Butyrivibrio sp. CB08]RKM59803.1 hypothetical protein D6855_08425 [Butyrivibrio sp. CB08]